MAAKRRKNIWPFDAFKTSTTYHVRGRQRGKVSSSAGSFKGHAIYRQGDGFMVPSIDKESVFDTKNDAKRFIGAVTKNPHRPIYRVYLEKARGAKR